MNYWLSFHPTLLAVIKVLAVVTGHIFGVIAAHDRAIKLLPARHHVSRPDRDAAGDGRLHRDRALPADGRVLSRPRRRRRESCTSARARRSGESPSSTTDLPATSALSVVGRSSGRKCTPAGRM